MRSAAVLLLFVAPVLAEEHVVSSEHYEVRQEGEPGDAEKSARVLEAAWPQFQRYFKAKPKLKKGEKLVVRYFSAREAWSKALQADGATVPDGAGGYYWPQTKTVYLYKQPTVYYSRVLLLHEAAHQFHYLSKTRNKNPDAAWYREGVAEYLSWHHWDGATLELAVQPNISLKDYAAAALTEAKAGGFDFAGLVEGKGTPSRAFSWSLVRYLATGGKDGKPLKRWEHFRRKMDGGVRPGPTFKKTIGQFGAAGKGYTAWLEENQQPFAYVFNEWIGIGPGRMHGFAGVVSVCRVKAPSKFFTATMEPPADAKGWKGGVLLHYTSKEDYSVALLDWGGFVHIQRFNGKRFQIIERGEVPAIVKGSSYVFQLFRRKNGVTMMIGNAGFGPWDLPGKSFGLAVQKSDLRFRDVSWK